MKKILIMMLVLGMLVSMLAGCATDDKKEETASSGGKVTTTKTDDKKADAEKTSEQVESTEPTVVKYVGWTPADKIAPAIDEFESMNPDIKIEYEVLVENNSLETLKKLDLLVLSGEQVDITEMPNQAEFVSRLLGGMFADLTPMIEAEGSYEDMYSVTTAYENKYYGLPVQINSWFVLINKDHLAEAGLEPPAFDWSWEDYAVYAEAMTNGEGSEKNYGSYFHTWDGPMKFASWNYIEGNAQYTADMKPNFDHPVFKEFLEFRYDMENDRGVSMPYYDAVSSKAHYYNFLSGDFSMTAIGSWTIASIVNDEKYPHDFETYIAALPRWKDGPAGRTFTNNSYLTVMENSENKEAAYRVARYMSNEGAYIRGQLSGAVDSKNKKLVADMISGKEALIDEESLFYFLDNKIDNVETNFDDNVKVLGNIFKEEAELYLVGGQDIDTTIERMMERANELY